MTPEELYEMMKDTSVKKMNNNCHKGSPFLYPMCSLFKRFQEETREFLEALTTWEMRLDSESLTALEDEAADVINFMLFMVGRAKGVTDLSRNTKALSNRGRQWLEFSDIVLKHIEEYTIPQYGDAPDDQIEPWSAEECILTIRKRCARFGSNARIGQELLDVKKMAHEACLAYFKMED